MNQPLLDAVSTGVEEPANVIHGVHYAGCQDDGREVIVSRCGIALDDSGEVDTPDFTIDACPACEATSLCPVCGAALVRVATAMSWANWD